MLISCEFFGFVNAKLVQKKSNKPWFLLHFVGDISKFMALPIYNLGHQLVVTDGELHPYIYAEFTNRCGELL
jgi:hypothetical protein